MAEILTESFCERCGTRYTFESAARRPTPFGAIGTVGRGIRNFVAMPDASLDEAFAAARAETEQGATAHQLEAFHRTFNFCLSCRQYTCGECWNAVEGRCLSCAPSSEREVRVDAVMAAEAMTIASVPPAASPFAAGPADLAWPTLELGAIDTAFELPEAEPETVGEAEGEIEPEAVVEAAPEAAVVTQPEAVVETEVETEPAAEVETWAVAREPAVLEAEVETPPAEPPTPLDEPAPTAAPVTPHPSRPSSLPAFAPGANLDEAIAAYDLRIAALSTPASMPSPQPPAAALQAAAMASASPTAPTGQRVMRSEGIPEAPEEVPATIIPISSIGTCPSCGLSLSASARFCRRCGTQQQHSA